MQTPEDNIEVLHQEVVNTKHQQFKVSDNGEFVDNVFKEVNASEIYGKLIGRKTVIPNQKATFTAVDIVREGYLWKRGSWMKNWKRRYFMIRHDIHSLCYFSSKDNLTLLGSVPLENGVYIWKVDPKEADGFENVIAVQPRNPQDVQNGVPPTMSSSAFFIRGDSPSDDLTKPQAAVPGGGVSGVGGGSGSSSTASPSTSSDSWLDVIVKEAEYGQNASNAIISGTNELTYSGNSALLLEEIMQTGGEYAWWDVLFSDAITVDPISHKAAKNSTDAVGVAGSKPKSLPMSAVTSTETAGTSATDASVPSSLVNATEALIIEESLRNSVYPDAVAGESTVAAPAAAAADVAADANAVEVDSDDDDEFEDDGTGTRGNSKDHQEASKSVDGSGSPVNALASESGADDSPISTPTVGGAKTLRNAPRRTGVTGVTKIDIKKKKTKVKVEKKENFEAAPFLDPSADAFETPDGISGVQLCVSIQHMVSCQDKIFFIVFGGKKTLLPSSKNGEKWGLVWIEVCRTEVAVVDNQAEYGGSYVESYCHRFSLLQCPWSSPILKDCGAVMIAMYKVEHSGSSGVNDAVVGTSSLMSENKSVTKKMGAPDIANHIALCRCILHRQTVLSKKLFTANMELLIDIPIDISAALLAPPNAMLGVVTMTSEMLHDRRQLYKSLSPVSPYAEIPYCFPTNLGNVMALEQLLVSPYSSSVASAFLSFLYQERAPLLDQEIVTIKQQLFSSAEMLAPITADPHLAAALEYQLHQHELLTKSLKSLMELQDYLVDGFADPYVHIQQNLLYNAHNMQNAVLNKNIGGNLLRRSAWKKNPPWQYNCVNLNFQLFSFQKCGYVDILRMNDADSYNLVQAADSEKQAAAAKTQGRKSSIDPIDGTFVPTITMGCPCAHELKYHDGGLLRLLSEPTASTGTSRETDSRDGGGGSTSGSSTHERRRSGSNNVVSSSGSAPNSSSGGSSSGASSNVIHGSNQNASSSNAAVRREWMRLLQSWAHMDELCHFIKMQRREQCTHVPNMLCHGSADPAGSSEAKLNVWLNRAALARRIDICSSQALGSAVSVVKAIVTFAASMGGLYMDILIRSLRVGFLVGFESFLSTQGDELGMLEDLDGAALWLSLVTVRLVTVTAADMSGVSKEELNDMGGQGGVGVNIGLPQNARSIGISHLMYNGAHTGSGKKLAVGKCQGITIRRGKLANLVVDIAIRPEEATTVARAVAAVAKLNDAAQTMNRATSATTPSSASSSSASSSSVSAVGAAKMNHINAPSVEALAECEYGVNEAVPIVHAAAELCGVTFSQGVNEMQTLANTYGGETVRKQIEINLESLSRFLAYYKKFKATLLLQMKLTTKPKDTAAAEARQKSAATKNAAPLQASKPVAMSKRSSISLLLGRTGKNTRLLYPSDEYSQRHALKSISAGSVKTADNSDNVAVKGELLVSYTDRMVEELIQCINSTSTTATEKNVNVLIKSSAAIRAVGGIVCILCKSGKDRTSMGATLDQGKALCEDACVIDAPGCIQAMRKYGARRMNVYANTGQSMFAFNSIQRLTLPSCFRPPLGTFTGKVHS